MPRHQYPGRTLERGPLSGSLLVRSIAWVSRHVRIRGVARAIWRLLPSERCPRVGGALRLRNRLRFEIDSRELIDWHLLFFGEYEPEIASLIRSVLRPGDNAIDVGANVGVHTAMMATVVEDGEVVACEPNPRAVQRLIVNVESNSLTNVNIYQVAVVDERRPVTLHVPPEDWRNAGMASLLPLADWPTVEVEGRSLDDIVADMGWKPIRLVKIDVEGSEPAVLRGAREVLRRFRPALIFEYQRDYWARSGGNVDAHFQELRELGYTFVRTVGSAGLQPLPHPLPESANIFAATSDPLVTSIDE